MAYNPTDHFISAKSLALTGTGIDARSMFKDMSLTPPKYRPYVSVAEALAYLSNPNPTVEKEIREGFFSIFIKNGGVTSEYWFKDGTLDVNLVEKYSDNNPINYYTKEEIDEIINSLTATASNGLTQVGSDTKLGGSLTENTTISTVSHNFQFDGATDNKFLFNSNGYSLLLKDGTLYSGGLKYVKGATTGFLGFGQFGTTTVPGDNTRIRLGIELQPANVASSLMVVDQARSIGLVNSGDYELNFLPRSLITKQYADSLISSITANNGLTKNINNIELGGLLTQNTSIDIADKTFQIKSTTVNVTGFIGLGGDSATFFGLQSPIGTLNKGIYFPGGIVTIIDGGLNGMRYNANYAITGAWNTTPRAIPDVGWSQDNLIRNQNTITQNANFRINGSGNFYSSATNYTLIDPDGAEFTTGSSTTSISPANVQVSQGVTYTVLSKDELYFWNGSRKAGIKADFTGLPAVDINLTLPKISGQIALVGDLSAYQLLSQKAQANGYASLDGGGKIPASQLPNSVMELQGDWNASTNTPTLVDGVGNPGDVYQVSVAGSQNLGSGIITYSVGDFVIYGAGGVWFKSLNSNAVTSVFGRTGIVAAVEADYEAFYPKLSGSYTDPSWISSLAYAKITGVPDFALNANVIHTTLNEIKNGRLTLNTPNGTDGSSPGSSVAPLIVQGGNGGTNTATTGFAIGGTATLITIRGGDGGGSFSSSGTKIGGNGAGIDIIGGSAGQAGTSGGTAGIAGSVNLQAGSVGTGSTNPGFAGKAFVKGGQNSIVGGNGGSIYLVPGFGDNNSAVNNANLTYDGNVFLGVNDNGNKRGAVIIGSDTSDTLNNFQVTGSSIFKGVTAALVGNLATAYSYFRVGTSDILLQAYNDGPNAMGSTFQFNRNGTWFIGGSTSLTTERSIRTNAGIFQVADSIGNKGLEYEGNYEVNFTSKSLITKLYVDTLVSGWNLQQVTSAGATTTVPITVTGGVFPSVQTIATAINASAFFRASGYDTANGNGGNASINGIGKNANLSLTPIAGGGTATIGVLTNGLSLKFNIGSTSSNVSHEMFPDGRMQGASPTNTNDFSTKGYVDTANALKANLTGGNTFTGNQIVNGDISAGVVFGNTVKAYDLFTFDPANHGGFTGSIGTNTSLGADRQWLFPDATGTVALTSNLAAYLPLTGGTLTGNLNGTTASFTGNVNSGGAFVINRAGATTKGIFSQTTASNRWFFGANATSESGSNLGSNFVIERYSDAGTSLGNALTIERNSGNASFSGNVISSVAPTIGSHLVNKTALDAAVAGYLPLAAGIGSPLTGALYINKNAAALSMKNTLGATGNVYAEFRNNADTRLGYVGFGSAANNNLMLTSDLGNITYTGTSHVFNSQITGTTAVLSGNYTGNNALATGATGTNRGFYAQTGGVHRWSTVADSNPESGSNTGSNFSINRFDDAGTLLGSALSINRATGASTFSSSVGAVGMSINGTSVGANNTRLLLNNSSGKTWSVSSGLVGINETDFGIFNVTDDAANPKVRIAASTGNVTLSGSLSGTSAVFSSTVIATTNIAITDAAATTRGIFIRTGANNRWLLYADTGAESGSNAGSNFSIASYADAGTFLANPLIINRATSLITVAANISAATAPTIGAHLTNKTYVDAQLPVSGSVSTTGSATTTFTVTIGATQANTTYKVQVQPTNALSAAPSYVTNKTTTTFDVVYLSGLTGTVAFDWTLFK